MEALKSHAVFINPSVCLGFNALNYVFNIILGRFYTKLQIFCNEEEMQGKDQKVPL